MNIDDKLNKMKPKDTPLLVLGYILLGMMLLLPATANTQDNEFLLDQTGDDLVLDIFQSGTDNDITINPATGTDLTIIIDQIGSGNTIKMYDYYSYIDGNNQSFAFYQNNDGTNQNVIELWHLDGDNNSIRWGQGGKLSSSTDTTFSYDGVESGGHYANLDIHGSGNNVAGFQANSGNGGHTYNQLIFSSYNDVYVEQRGDGAKTLNLTISNNDNTVSAIQRATSHTATINLSGSYGTALNLLQQGTTAQSYSLSQSCATLGGCSISVTQGN